MEPLEVAQWIAIGMLIWRVMVLEASQLTKDDFKPIHKRLDEIMEVQQRFVKSVRSLSGLGRN